MSAQKDISINDIEQILETFPEKFTVAEIQKKLGNRSDGLARRLERLLDGDDRFFNRSKHEFIRREHEEKQERLVSFKEAQKNKLKLFD